MQAEPHTLMSYEALENLRRNHPAWRLLRADSAPMVVSFLQRIFIAANRREMAQADLVEALEDELYDDLREDRIAPQLRLEQERIDFAFVERAVAAL